MFGTVSITHEMSSASGGLFPGPPYFYYQIDSHCWTTGLVIPLSSHSFSYSAFTIICIFCVRGTKS